jgi:hypothetical protein
MSELAAAPDRERTVTGTDPNPTLAPQAAALGPTAAVLACGWLLAHGGRAAWPYTWAGSAAVLALILLARPVTRRGVLRRLAAAPLQIVAVLLVFLTADRALNTWEEHGPQLGAVSTLASSVLNLVGYRTAVEEGRLLLDHPDGVVTLVSTIERLAVRPFVLFWFAWAALRLTRDGRRWTTRSLAGLVAVLLVAVARFVVLLAVYFEHDDILADPAGQAALDLFQSSWITAFFLIVAGFAADRLAKSLHNDEVAPISSSPSRSCPGSARLAAAAVMFGLAATAAFGWAFVPPGPEKDGRILIDDRFCGIWEPTARQLDAGWYGDFPTYSFTSLAEWLGKWYTIDVNTSKPYDDELLSRYDILIFKTPEEPIPDAEAAAVNRFVREGGGLLLVGDHTNLLGMGTHLNALCARHGIRFRYDSVSDGLTGGFVNCLGPSIGRHVGALHVDNLEFMTSCSLQLSGRAEPVLAADDCKREPHDYAGPSFFGRRGPHPEMEHGRTVLAATVPVGRGRIAAFTDSTVWSSFAVFSHDRDKLAMDLVRLLNRDPTKWGRPIRFVSIASALVALALAVALVRTRMALAAVLCGLGGLWTGLALSEGLHRWIYAWPEPNARISEVAFLWQGGECAFPPVLGTPESTPADRCYDTLMVSVQRLGLVPRVAYTYDQDLFRPDTRVIFVIAPVNVPPAATLSRIKDFVRRGGSLIVMDDSRIGERGSANEFLKLFDASITYHGPSADHSAEKPHVHIAGMDLIKTPSTETFATRKVHEQGQLVYLWDAKDYSREFLGHCFARPWKAAKARYDTIYSLFRDILHVAPGDRRFYGVF